MCPLILIITVIIVSNDVSFGYVYYPFGYIYTYMLLGDDMLYSANEKSNEAQLLT